MGKSPLFERVQTALREAENNGVRGRFSQLAVCVSLLVLIWVVYFPISLSLSRRNDFNHLTHEYFSCVYQIDSIEDDGKTVTLTGWGFKLDTDSAEKNMGVYLYDLEEEKIIYGNITYFGREDVNQYFLCEYDYTHSGFKVSFNSDKLNLLNKDYEVLIEDKIDKNVFKTGIYLSKGEVVYANPKEFYPVATEGTGLEEIVSEGTLRVFRPEVGVYVYQYMNKLYWIAEEKYYFEEDESTYLQMHSFTTQKEKLPKHRVDMGYDWDNVGFSFEENEVLELRTEKYRVSMTMIPSEYSVYEIKTGYYDEKWMWSQRFRPYFDFAALRK